MRTKNSIKNSIYALLSSFLILAIGFVSQTFFIKILGSEYLGINGLFNNIVSVLAIVELGIGPAIIFSLYEPIAKNDKEKIKSLMNFYKKSYLIIGLIVFVLGLIITPFINFFVNTTLHFQNLGGIYSIFLLFVLDSSFSYFLSYKRSIIQADQKNRIISLTHLICYLLMTFLQILILYITKKFILYLVIKLIFRMLENIILNAICNREYPYIKEPSIKLGKSEKDSIFKKVKGLIYHKIGSYVVSSTNTILISKFLGVAIVGLYSNYYLIISSVALLISQIFSSLTASVGNLLVDNNKEKSFDIYKKILFFNFLIYCFAATAIFNMMSPFINIWLGEKYLLNIWVLALLVINFYNTGLKSSIGVYKDATGIYYEDRFIPVIESILNITLSLIFVSRFGLAGIFLGTLLSSFVVILYSLPHYVFKVVFRKSTIIYYALFIKYFVITIISALTTYFIYNKILVVFNLSAFMKFVFSATLSISIPFIIIMLLFIKSSEVKYFIDLFKQIIRREER